MLLLPLLVAQTWSADNDNGTFTNRLLFDEFSDPDMIRVGDHFQSRTARIGNHNGCPAAQLSKREEEEFGLLVLTTRCRSLATFS